jgi:pathogenesis-related protein 1
MCLWISGTALLSLLLVLVLSAHGQEKGGDEPAATGSALTDQEAKDLVAFHNKVRKEVGVGPVKWSAEIAKFAQAWADELAKNGKFGHRPRDKGPWTQKYGENIAGFQKGGVLEGAQLWYGEKKDYTPGMAIPKDFAAFKAGHYTQMVWKDTTEIGAGKAIYKMGAADGSGWPRQGASLLVCNYNPPGNFIGKPPY